MKKNHRIIKFRWLLYAFIAILFGIFDFHWQIWTTDLVSKSILFFGFVVVWGIFLLTALPTAILEFISTHSTLKSAFATSFSWSISIISYYVYMICLKIFVYHSSSGLWIGHHNEIHWSENVRNAFIGIFTEDIPPWLLVAIIGGAVIGFIVSTIYKHYTSQK